MLAAELNEQHFSHLNLEQTCMALTLELKIRFLEVLNTSSIYPNTSAFCQRINQLQKIMTYVPNK